MLKKGEIKNSRYRIIRQIGKGGTSNVYLCTDNHIKKLWAMKEISKKDHLGMTLAKREVDMLKAIDYKMFPRIVDAFMEGESLYIISDYVEGLPLDRVLKEGKIKRSEACRWMTDIIMAISYLHGLSPPILFLDLKPENILLKADGELAMVDFGIAGRITGNLIPMGTPGYAAPEQYRRDIQMVDERTDIYALGKLYYAIRSGRVPDKDLGNDRDRINADKIFNKKEKAFICKCIEEDSENRYQTAEDALRAIKKVNASPFRMRRLISSMLILVSVILIVLFVYQGQKKELMYKASAKEMIDRAQVYKEGGEYTSEGIKIIENFINSDCLESDTKERFSYEVARNYFEVQKDYKMAERYFRNLNPANYPEVRYYIELCRLMQVFDYDEDKVGGCIGRMYGDVYKLAASKRKYDAILFVSKCYEEYTEDRIEGIKKALAVLEEGLIEIKATKKNNRDYETIQKLKTTYENRIALLLKKAEIAAKK